LNKTIFIWNASSPYFLLGSS